MGRPSAVTPPVEALLRGHVEPGISARVLHARIGGAVSLRTVSRWLERRGGAPAEPTIAERAAALVSGAPEDAPAALESDDLGRLERVRSDLDTAMARWRQTLSADGGSVRAYRDLANIYANVTAKIVELRPRPEREYERLAALGDTARAALLARARANAAADEDLRGRVRRQQELIDRLIDEGGDT